MRQMALRGEKRLLARIALVIAVCFCALSVAQIARPLRCADRVSTPLVAAAHEHLTRHTLQEVSPRGARLTTPYVIGVLPIVQVSAHGRLPRMAAYLPFWPMESWPIHRRLAPACADSPALPA
jgi:hypothetical protein